MVDNAHVIRLVNFLGLTVLSLGKSSFIWCTVMCSAYRVVVRDRICGCRFRETLMWNQRAKLCAHGNQNGPWVLRRSPHRGSFGSDVVGLGVSPWRHGNIWKVFEPHLNSMEKTKMFNTERIFLGACQSVQLCQLGEWWCEAFPYSWQLAPIIFWWNLSYFFILNNLPWE